jgi:hypothetical protein
MGLMAESMAGKKQEIILMILSIIFLIAVVGIMYLAMALKTGAASTGMGIGGADFVRNALLAPSDGKCELSAGFQAAYPDLKWQCNSINSKGKCNTFFARGSYPCKWAGIEE